MKFGMCPTNDYRASEHTKFMLQVILGVRDIAPKGGKFVFMHFLGFWLFSQKLPGGI